MAVTKRIFQLAKEFERDEKEIMAFLATQGVKVSNRLSAVNEETYNMLKAKFMAPPLEPEPAPAPKPEPEIKEESPGVESSEAPAQQQSQSAPQGKKKKKKNKPPQPSAETTEQEQGEEEVSDAKIESMDKRTQTVLFEAIKAGNEFIRRYSFNPGITKIDDAKKKGAKPILTRSTDTWAILYNLKFDNPDSSPVRYWQAVAKLATKAFKLMNSFGMSHREPLAEMRQSINPVGKKYEPREIFTDEENQKFEEQQLLLFRTFGHGMGMVNDNLYAMKFHAEHMKVKYERMDFLEYIMNPDDELRSKERVPFSELVEAVTYSVRGVARRFGFYQLHKERINNIVGRFFEWLDGYAKLKEQGADTAKLEKYLELEEKFVTLAEFMSFDNFLDHKASKPAPFDILFDLLHAYRDNMDDPDAERNFKYKARGITNLIYKPKEYVFLYNFAGLEPQKDYRSPEDIAAAEAAKAAKAAAVEAATAEAAAAEAAEVAEKENPAATDDEA